MEPKRIVITGGPGSGKTSVIKKLEEDGFTCIHEISRTITLEARTEGIPQLFTTNPLLFSKRILDGRISQFQNISNIGAPYIFYDRGIPDVVAYMDTIGQSYGEEFTDACRNFTYDGVFLLPPWEDIYISDNERYESFQDALIIHGFLERTYKKFGYQIMDVPVGTIAQRVSFILENLKTNNG